MNSYLEKYKSHLLKCCIQTNIIYNILIKLIDNKLHSYETIYFLFNIYILFVFMPNKHGIQYKR